MLRVLSCNLFYGRADARALLELIESESVDLVCAQELSPGVAARLAELLPHGDVEQLPRLFGNGIASRFPVTTRRIPLPRRSGCVARLSPEHWPALSADVEIVNVHLAAPHVWPWFPNRLRRAHQVEALLADRASAGDVAQALLGDFNATPAWPAYRRMAAGYIDAAAQHGGGSTWPRLRRFGLDGLWRIDHCFVKGLETVSLETVDVPGSDHMGILVELKEQE